MPTNLGLSNFYGKVEAVEIHGEYFLQLGDHIGMDQVQISKELYEMIKKEFENK